MEPGGFDELDIKLKLVMSALIEADPGFEAALEHSAHHAMASSVDPLERYALADVLEFLHRRQRPQRIARA